MKKLVSLMLVLGIILSMSTMAFAEAVIANQYTLKSRNVELNPRNNTLAVFDENGGGYQLVDAAGHQVINASFINMSSNGNFFEVATESGLNVRGLIDATGGLIMPMQYADIEVVSDRWQLGVILQDATVDNYDYKSYDGGFWLITNIDVYFMGNKVGELGRTECSSAQAYGNFLYVRDKAGKWAYYDQNFVRSASQGDSGNEYVEDYRTHSVWHSGSNQQAFVAGCTLTPDDVEQSIHAINGQFFDLQGNLLFKAASPYDSVYDYEGDYAKVKAYGKYGLIDRQGNEVVPCAYDEIYCYEAYLAGGYQSVVKDGKIGYVDAQGQETCEFKYTSNVASGSRGNFTYIKDLDGSYIVLSAAVGELPGRYEDIGYSSSESCPLLAVTQNGMAGVIDLNGAQIIPPITDHDCFDFTVSDDGSVVLQYDGYDSGYTVYQISNAMPAAPAVQSAAPAVEQSAAPEAGQPESKPAGEWTCSACGQSNSGNFCINCGAPRPVEEAPVCSNCGYTSADGIAFNFCPQCGTAFAK